MSEFTDYLSEVFQHFGAIRTRRMFGGYGVFLMGLNFAAMMDVAADFNNIVRGAFDVGSNFICFDSLVF